MKRSPFYPEGLLVPEKGEPGEPKKGASLSPSAISPTAPRTAMNSQNSQNINVQQTLNFEHGGTDAQRTADSVGRAVQNAFRQIPALAQGA